MCRECLLHSPGVQEELQQLDDSALQKPTPIQLTAPEHLLTNTGVE